MLFVVVVVVIVVSLAKILWQLLLFSGGILGMLLQATDVLLSLEMKSFDGSCSFAIGNKMFSFVSRISKSECSTLNRKSPATTKKGDKGRINHNNKKPKNYK